MIISRTGLAGSGQGPGTHLRQEEGSGEPQGSLIIIQEDMQKRLCFSSGEDWMIGQNIGHRLFKVVAEGRERVLGEWGGGQRQEGPHVADHKHQEWEHCLAWP